MSATLWRGSPSMRDFTATAPVTAGDVIDVGGLAMVAHGNIEANELGALATPSNQAAYTIDLTVGTVLADGAAVTIDPATGTVPGLLHFGYAEGATTATDTQVISSHSKAL